jgi:hypothetical protein
MNNSENNGGSESVSDHRHFSRVDHYARVELHQGGEVWEVDMLDISLRGITVNLPLEWDADYSHPFNFVLPLQGEDRLEATAHLVQIVDGTMGLEIEHLSDDQLELLKSLLAVHLDEDTLAEEIARLKEISGPA